MSRLELTKSAINSMGYVDVDRKNLETIEAEIRADERKKVLDEVYAIALNENYDTLIEWLQNNIID